MGRWKGRAVNQERSVEDAQGLGVRDLQHAAESAGLLLTLGVVRHGDAVIAALKGVPVVMPMRTTFYGAREIGVKDPAGHVVTFAQYGPAPQH